MYEPISRTWQFKSPVLWVDLALSLVVIAFLLVLIIGSMKKLPYLIGGIVACCISVIAWFFGLKFLWAVMLVLITAFLIITITQKQIDFKEIFSNMFQKNKGGAAQKVYDRHAVCQKIAIAVETLSRTKTGALITFEKNITFSEIVKSGTILNAPITPELLTTIFYPGTRLHDGAVVIRRDQILAASVYYTPTTKPLTGKFGSRHRAAIGISEITDSVTVIVSEETGRVSLAYHGELISVAPDSFLRTLEEYLFAEEKEQSEEK